MKTLRFTLFAVVSLFLLSSHSAKTQPANAFAGKPATQINWMSWEEAMELTKKEKRKILLDVYTDWCKWCKQMESTTFQQPEIARYINEHYYPVKFDAEQRNELEYRKKVYKYVKNGQVGYHELAAELLRGRLSYPALVFMDEDLNVIQSFNGFKTAQQLEQIASYFATDEYKRTPWSNFQKNFKPLSFQEK